MVFFRVPLKGKKKDQPNFVPDKRKPHLNVVQIIRQALNVMLLLVNTDSRSSSLKKREAFQQRCIQLVAFTFVKRAFNAKMDLKAKEQHLFHHRQHLFQGRLVVFFRRTKKKKKLIQAFPTALLFSGMV